VKYHYGLDREVREIVGRCVRDGIRDAVEWAEQYAGIASSKEHRNATASALVQRMERGEKWEEMANAIVGAINRIIDGEIEKAKACVAASQNAADERKRKYDALVSTFEDQDDMCRRVAALQVMIDKMLPEQSRSGETNYTQWIRSRGLAISAALGMTSIGGSSIGKDQSSSRSMREIEV